MGRGTPKPQQNKCPYWALEKNRECGLSKGGMYIPMPGHVKMFCHSAKFNQCPKYLKGVELIISKNRLEPDRLMNKLERRRLKRYPENLYLDLVAFDRNRGSQAMKAYKAKSLDVSLGGLRVECFKEFSTEAVVSFAMDPDFAEEALVGVGEVKWCEPIKDSKKFETGIAFLNYSTSQSMREYLDI